METLQDLLAAGRIGNVHPTDPYALAKYAGEIIRSQPKKTFGIFQIQGKLDWLRDEALRLKQYLTPAQSCDDEIKDLNKQIAEVEKSLAWAKSQKNFKAESDEAAFVTQQRLDKLREEVKDLTKRRDRNLKIADSIRKQIEAYATKEQIAEWKESLRNFEAIQKLNHVPDNGRYQSFSGA
jgi:vacuolar-type H+-ATPase subunit I/STV1